MSAGEDTGAEVEAIIADRFRVDSDAFDQTTGLGDAPLGADSLDRVELAEAIEATLGVHIPDEALDRIETVGDLKRYVTQHR